jgi:hypothetical protein
MLGMTVTQETNAGPIACSIGPDAGDSVGVTVETILDDTSTSLNIMIGTSALTSIGGWGIRDV